MVIGLLAVAAIPTVTGVGQAVSAQRKQNAQAKEQEQFHLGAVWPRADGQGFYEAAACVLCHQRILLQFPHESFSAHLFCGYFFSYPSPNHHLGLVSTISLDPPMLNWIYVDAQTRALAHGSRKDSLGHITGPWGWTADEALVTLHGSAAGFVAARHDDVGWRVYWHPDLEVLHACEVRPLWLRRKPLLGIESRYVTDGRDAGRGVER
ncbi:hypothetical protein CDD81_2121 [Ophiocordyceps australis]|uniref:Uncharacterized protein n=1 Tax=Ophiocordyceps australis TaxID=1399860 RepID=A0A2C5X7R9_9HYPO|nr:hypothetical protein CDD81_2121 [Ophiocordyceps australis]